MPSVLTAVQLTDVFTDQAGHPLAVYADSIYCSYECDHLIAPYTGSNADAMMKKMSKIMSALRISVEWSIGKAYAVCRFLRQTEVLLPSRYRVCGESTQG